LIRLVVAAGLALAGIAWAGEAEDLKALRARLERLRADVAATESRRTETQDALRESEQAISEANRSLVELAGSKREAQAELDRIATETRTLQGELDARQRDLARLLHARYTGGETSAVKLLLSGEDPGKLQRELVYYGHLSRAHLAFIERLRADLARLAELERRARDKTAEIAAFESAAAKERQVLQARHAERQRVLDGLSTALKAQQRTVASLERDEQRLAKLLEDIARTLRNPAPPAPVPRGPRNDAVPEAAPATAFVKLKGRLRLPVRGELATRFGTQRTDGGPPTKGVFITTRPGEDVRAVASGRVVYADWMRGFGNLLILDHGDGYMTIYGNNEAVLRRLGDAVHAGEVVATAGASGGAETSGLYFEIRHQGRAFDPLPWVSLK
jgi:septal ring factor EnvC (AmiA/AmiB activator)